MGYTKNIAIIRGLKSGFSADGGELSGIIKAEKYGSSLKVEASLINFAPLTEGRYVIGLSDGKRVCVLDGLNFEGASEVDTGQGFAAVVFFVKGGVQPIASAVCGGKQSAAIGIREEVERLERVERAPLPPEPKINYEDEALAEENYYEYEQTDKDGGALRENKEKEENGQVAGEDAAASRAFEESAGGGLARGECFYARMKDEIEKVLSSYPEERGLSSTVDNSRWVKINYGGDKFYVFGIIYDGGVPQYICYGVPSSDSRRPPESLLGMASFIPAADGADAGFWVMYQDAQTGASVKIDAG